MSDFDFDFDEDSEEHVWGLAVADRKMAFDGGGGGWMGGMMFRSAAVT
jgi:ribulose 1,5-bisphosphate synthetase/thiazole synthase